MDSPKVKIVFDDSFFEEFDGTQEELDNIIAEINRLVETGEILDEAIEVDLSEEDLAMIAESQERILH